MATKTNIFTTHGTDILVYKKGGGRIALFGLPFFLAGLFVAQIPFGIIPVDVEGGPLVLAILLPLGTSFRRSWLYSDAEPQRIHHRSKKMFSYPVVGAPHSHEKKRNTALIFREGSHRISGGRQKLSRHFSNQPGWCRLSGLTSHCRSD